MAAADITLRSIARCGRLTIAALAGLLMCFVLQPLGVAAAQEGRGQALPEGEGRELVASACAQCHGLRETTNLRETQHGWSEIVDLMVLYGAQLTPQEAERVKSYLGRELGPGTTPMAGEGNSHHGPVDLSLPPGPGQSLVATRCVLCHDLGRVVGIQRPRRDWELMTTSMLSGLPDTPGEIQMMIAYLQANFSPSSPASTGPAGRRTRATSQTQPKVATQAPPQAQSRVATQAPPQAQATPAGMDVFAKQCQVCHSIEPGKVRLGPSLHGEMSGQPPKMTESEVRTIVNEGKGKMPGFKDVLSKEDMEKLLGYLRTL